MTEREIRERREARGMADPTNRLVHHVSGAIERGEAEPILEVTPKARLEELRVELRAERLSYGELAELQGLVEYIDPGDVELLEAAGVAEGLAPPGVFTLHEIEGGEGNGIVHWYCSALCRGRELNDYGDVERFEVPRAEVPEDSRCEVCGVNVHPEDS